MMPEATLNHTPKTESDLSSTKLVEKESGREIPELSLEGLFLKANLRNPGRLETYVDLVNEHAVMIEQAIAKNFSHRTYKIVDESRFEVDSEVGIPFLDRARSLVEMLLKDGCLGKFGTDSPTDKQINYILNHDYLEKGLVYNIEGVPMIRAFANFKSDLSMLTSMGGMLTDKAFGHIYGLVVFTVGFDGGSQFDSLTHELVHLVNHILIMEGVISFDEEDNTKKQLMINLIDEICAYSTVPFGSKIRKETIEKSFMYSNNLTPEKIELYKPEIDKMATIWTHILNYCETDSLTNQDLIYNLQKYLLKNIKFWDDMDITIPSSRDKLFDGLDLNTVQKKQVTEVYERFIRTYKVNQNVDK